MTTNKYSANVEVTGKGGHKSIGHIINSVCQTKTYLLTSKHSVCVERELCVKIGSDINSCRACDPKVDLSRVSIVGTLGVISPVNLNVSSRTDIALLQVDNIEEVPVLKVTQKKSEDYYLWYDSGEKRHIFNKPDICNDGKIKFNLLSNVTAELEPKSSVLSGTSGGMIFKHIGEQYYATAILTEDGGVNDIGAEKLDDELLSELNSISGTTLFEVDRNTIYNSTEKLNARYDFNEISHGALYQLIRKSEELSESDPDYKYMLEELSEFLDNRPGRKILGLDQKLTEGKRDDLLDDAKYLSNKFARRVSRHQFSKTDNVLFFHCLSVINSSFKQSISAAIKSGEPDKVIDGKILNEIVLPLYNEVSVFSVSISTELIRGMIFYLTGKCHIRWAK